MSNVINLKKAPVSKRSRMDTLAITQGILRVWQLPPFQRPLRVNEKVRQIAEQIRDDGGVVPGVITLGVIEKGPQKGTYIIDGQHRIHALEMSGVDEAYADVRIMEFDTIAEMGQEFVELNSQIVRMRPDDVLRGIEESTPTLKAIRKACPFVGYDNIRRGGSNHPVVSLSMILRLWAGSEPETPTGSNVSALQSAQQLLMESAEELVQVLNLCYTAWGRQPETQRLWSGLNMGLVMWLFRRTVLDTDRSGNKRSSILKAGQFGKCLQSLATAEGYADWLVGRNLGDRDRPPAYTRIKSIFTLRLKADGFADTIRFPQPAWALGSSK